MSVATDEAPVLRLLPAPDPEPALNDDGRRLHALSQREVLPLDWPLPSGVGATPRPRGLVLVRTPPVDDFGPVRTSRHELPEPTPWAARLVQGIAEVLALDRPAAQLARWVSAEVYDDVRRRVEVRGRLAQPATRANDHRPCLRSVHVTEPADGVAEVCALVSDGRRVRAYALRLEGCDGRWRATALELV